MVLSEMGVGPLLRGVFLILTACHLFRSAGAIECYHCLGCVLQEGEEKPSLGPASTPRLQDTFNINDFKSPTSRLPVIEQVMRLNVTITRPAPCSVCVRVAVDGDVDKYCLPALANRVYDECQVRNYADFYGPVAVETCYCSTDRCNGGDGSLHGRPPATAAFLAVAAALTLTSGAIRTLAT